MIDSFPDRVLVAYASKLGSTREVAEVVAGVLSAEGHHVDFRHVTEVRDLDSYAGVVVGGSIYVGRWHPDALEFLELHSDGLTERPLAVFALGPRRLTDAEVAQSRAQLDSSLAKVPQVTPATVAIFGGVVDPTKLSCPFNRLPASDARDWTAIREWAAEASSLFEAQAVPL
jgi:menaquinone-dependent protoporphyrinogen oxidase